MTGFLPPSPEERCAAIVPEAGGRYAGRCRRPRVGASVFCADHEAEAETGRRPMRVQAGADVARLARAFLEWSHDDPRRWTTAFLAWAEAHQIPDPLRREVRVAILRNRSFGEGQRVGP